MKEFSSLQLSAELLRAIGDVGYDTMTDIQERAIPLALEGGDLIGRSSTGTGKTAAFGIPVVERCVPGVRTQALILCPTRELAMQIAEEIRKFAKYKPGIGIATVYGGQSMETQIRQLRTAAIVIGTPGRVMDHMRRKTLRLDGLKIAVLDEADEMLNMGFYEDMQTILSEAPEERQTLLFSATMSPEIMRLTGEFQKDPKMVAVDQGKKTIGTIEQLYYQVPQSRKIDTLKLLLELYEPKRSLIFCNTKKMVDDLVAALAADGFRCIGLHGDMKQQTRTQVMEEFKSGRIGILIATDVAARGIDAPDVEAVFNYDIPQEFEYYIHRIGRTGRAGKTGRSFTLATNRSQVYKIREIERFTGAPIALRPAPNAREIAQKKQELFLGRVAEAAETKPFEEWRPLLGRLLETGISAEEAALALMGMFAQAEPRRLPVLPKEEPARPEGGASGRRVWVSLDIGRDQRIAPNYIVGAMVDAAGIPAKAIGKIEIYDGHTNVELSRPDAELVMENMQGSRIRGCPVKVTLKGESEGRMRYGQKRRPGSGKTRFARDAREPYTKRRGARRGD